MRSFLLAATLGAAESLAVDVTHKSKKPAVQALMESATAMLRTGATPDVVEFTTITLSEVSDTVFPAIRNESINDQNFIYSLYSRFDVVNANLVTSNQKIFQLNSEEQTLSQSHKSCRSIESGHCESKRQCEMELHRLWVAWVTEEEELREIHDRIDSHFCPPDANGTLHAFRVASVPMMQQYMAKKILVDAAEQAFDSLMPHCVETHVNLDTSSSTCNVLQSNLEEISCQHGAAINEALNTFYNGFLQARSAYNCAVEEIMQLENDRKREWKTLQVVNCLLERIQMQNGVPCDSEDRVTEEVGHCEALHGNNPCVSEEGGDPILCLDYQPLPPPLPDCPARDEVIGECLPVWQPLACTGEWDNQEYSNLPAVPQPPFNHENPGCNAYPECVACLEIPAVSLHSVDSCPGYTVDGCPRDGEEGEHPLTFVRNVADVADVRCCSIDGATCQSQDTTGPYQDAMAVCHDAGMRMCTADEVAACCSTESPNHNPVWVDVAPGDRD